MKLEPPETSFFSIKVLPARGAIPRALWFRRLMAKTPDCRSENGGSIPLGTATKLRAAFRSLSFYEKDFDRFDEHLLVVSTAEPM
jgi:hypothetical protein